MASLPPYVTVRMSGHEEDIAPSVQRTEMERGPAKQVLLNSQVTMNPKFTLLFKTTADHEMFIDWYLNTIQCVDYFNMIHPRTGELIKARFPEGKIGTLRSLSGTDQLWQRDVTLEYLR